jgi:myo-inositol-1(or 4)-monophosphatase
MTTLPPLSTLLQTAERTAVSAGKLAREKWAQPMAVTSKGFRDVVTETDFAAQALITDAILAQFPTHGFLTEEEDSSLPQTGEVIWIIDPIDGTINFSRMLPEFCVSVAAIRGGAPIADLLAQPEVLAGAIYDPMRGELFSGAAGLGATMQIDGGEKRPLSVSAVTTLESALLTHDWSHEVAGRQTVLDVLGGLAHHVFSTRSFGSAALALAWLAAGRSDLYFNYSLKPWDVAAAQVLFAEAGGTISNGDGSPLRLSVDGMSILASNGRLHSELTRVIAQSTTF